MDIVVLKFGGSSVADNEKLELVARKIISYVNSGSKVVVVVSAQGKKTDSLLNEAYSLSINPSSRELDVLLSTGEQITISKLSILLNKMGYPATSLTGWQAGIYTNLINQNASIEHINTERIVKELTNDKIVVVAGFQGVNENIDITTLGRGGSDTTAVSIAAALNAKCCYIYSDVDGIFTTDPNKLKSASKLDELSFDEMLDISNEGAKVLHNRCVEIGKKFNIPIVAKSTFNDNKGTVVNNKIEEQKVKSIVKNDDLVSLDIIKDNISNFDIYNLCINNEIVPLNYIYGDNSISILLKESSINKLEYILDAHIKDYNMEKQKISRISIIGYGITYNTNILKKVAKIMEENKDIVQSLDLNGDKIRITFKNVVDNSILEKIHKALIPG